MILLCRTRSNQWLETFFGRAANRAAPIIRCLFEFGPFGNLALPVSPVRIKNTPAVYGLALIHIFRFGHAELLG